VLKMRTKKDQHTVGTPVRPRGQQTGFAGHNDQNREEKAETPALEGGLESPNKMFADASSQHVGSDSTKPSTNSPSVPAMNVRAKGASGGETQFKKRLAKKREKD
jgi:hypothetical protein